jgi:hypothetical protein
MKDDQREDAASHDLAKEVYWTPLMAAVWIVYRDMDEVRKVWSGFVKDRCGFNFEDNRKYVVSPNEAVRELWRRLESGELVATGIFQGLRRVIKPWEWLDLLPIDCEQPGRFFYGRQFPRKIYIGRPPMIFDDVRLPAKDVLDFFPTKDVAARANSSPGQGTDDKARALILQAMASSNGFISQKNGARIVRDKLQDFPVTKAMKLTKELTKNTKPGPRGPRRKSSQ